VLIGDALYDYGFSARGKSAWRVIDGALPGARGAQEWIDRDYDPDRRTNGGLAVPFQVREITAGEDPGQRAGAFPRRGTEHQSTERVFLWFRQRLYIYDLSSPPRAYECDGREHDR